MSDVRDLRERLGRHQLLHDGDYAGTVDLRKRMSRAYADPFNFNQIAEANQQILMGWLKLWGLGR